MKIYNTNKTQELNANELDFKKGYLKADKLATVHHEATPVVKGRSAMGVAAELKAQDKPVVEINGQPYMVTNIYKNGNEVHYTPDFDLSNPAYGKLVVKIEAEPDTPAKEAWDEYEDIKVYVPYTEEELKERAERKELVDLEKWFTEVYDAQVKQYNRCQRLGVEYDNKYGTIAELDTKATVNAKRISELRNKYSTK